MKLHRANVEKVVKINGLRPTRSATPLERGLPTSEGIFSNQIFGTGTDERKNIPAYIDLHGWYLHPLAYNALKTLNRKFESVVAGTMRFSFDKDNKLIEDPENGDTGLEFLYKNWDKVKDFADRSSVFSTQRIKLLQSKEKSWTNKWIIIPAFFRDLNFNEEGRPSYDIINEIYMNLIRQSEAVAHQAQYGGSANNTRARVQGYINEIHDMIIDAHFRSKGGTFKRYNLGKNVILGARFVISAPIIKGERYNDVQVQFNRVGVPLAGICSVFFPFVVYHTRMFFQNEFELAGKYAYRNEKGELSYITLKNPEYYSSQDYIIKMIKRYIYGVSTRFDPIPIPENLEGVTGYMYMVGRNNKDKSTIQRPLTWTDIFYKICVDHLEDGKHIYFTRYPIEDNFGINPSKFTVMSTKNTMPVLIGDKVYPYYPKIEIGKPSDIAFIDTLHVHNSYLPGLGGDYDGDMLSITGCFSDEANADAEKYTKDKKYYLSLTGDMARVIQRDLIQTFFALTKTPNQVGINFDNLSDLW